MRNIPLLLVLAFLLAGNAHAELYRSIDKDGKVHYSDTPLQDSDDVAELKVDKAPVPEENLPYETRRAMQNFPVTLYTFPDCGALCQKARDVLNKRGIPYTEKSIKTQEEMEAYNKESGDRQMPGLLIGKSWLKGVLEERWNKELDFAGYPKFGGYRAPKPAAPAAP